MSYNRYSPSVSIKGMISLIILLLMIPYLIWFYSASKVGVEVVQSKWTESHTSCSDDGCSTSTSYMVQMENGSIYSVFWGTRDWDRMVVGKPVWFKARGRDIRIFGWRFGNPTIFTVQIPPPAQ